MASSKVMPSSSSTSTSTNSDLTHNHNHNHHHHHHHHHHQFSSVNPSLNYSYNHLNYTNNTQMIPDETPVTVDSIFSEQIPDNSVQNGGDNGNCGLLDTEITLIDAAGAISAVDCGGGGGGAVVRSRERKTVDDIWREIVAGGKSGCDGDNVGERRECKAEVVDEIMTLEDFLARATAGEEEEEEVVTAAAIEEDNVKVEVTAGGIVAGGGMYGFDQQAMVQAPGTGYAIPLQHVPVGVGNGGGVGVGVGGRGKRSRGSGVMLEPMDKAAQQRQRRMIKNRESAARSRERKQAYQVELEALAAKLEEENEQLLREKAVQTKERYKQLMEKVVPVVEKRRPPRTLRKVRSMQW